MCTPTAGPPDAPRGVGPRDASSVVARQRERARPAGAGREAASRRPPPTVRRRDAHAHDVFVKGQRDFHVGGQQTSIPADT
jgi:hypothetical protein